MAFPIGSGSDAAANLIRLTAEVYATRQQYTLTQINAALELRAARQTAKANTGPSDKQVRLQAQQIKLLGIKDGFADAAELLNATDTGLNAIEGELTILKTTLSALGPSSTAQDRADAADSLKQSIDKVNTYANVAEAGGLNLIGTPTLLEFTTDTLQTNYGLFNEFIKVEGQFNGIDSYLTDGSDNTYIIDRNQQKLIQYSGYPDNPTGTTYDLADLVVSNFDEATDEVTFSGPVALTATVTRGGVGILDPELYENFATDAAVTRAIADIDAALDSLTQAKATFGDAKMKLNIALGDVQTELDVVDRAVDAEIARNLTEREAEERAAELAFYSSTYSLELSLGSQAAMIDFLQPGEIDRAGMGVLGFVKKK
ncbi:MAG: hypothetical protein QNJ92_08035 [Alphaproteobacteria bacterium]|nr:hypothetical protein [Alphaproteobacteria bacterium]